MAKTAPPLLTVADLSWRHHGHAILDHVNFSVHPGELVAIVGPNGAGKTTLLHCIAGLTSGYQGKIVMRGALSYLGQTNRIPVTFPATVGEILRSGTLSHRPYWPFVSRQEKELVTQAAQTLALTDLLARRWSDLSGGQRQRVLIARALCARQQLLLLDEPTNNLDPDSAQLLYDHLVTLVQQKHLSVIIIGHDQERLDRYATRVLTLTEGRVSSDRRLTHRQKGEHVESD